MAMVRKHSMRFYSWLNLESFDIIQETSKHAEMHLPLEGSTIPAN